jgi:hypothetical protein
LSAYLGSKFHIDYKNKMNDWEGLTATGLSRKNKQVSNEAESLKEMETLKIEPFFLDWLRNPCADWSLPKKLADSLE